MKKNITIKEIAAEAKVSIATVSLVINKKDKKISQETRNRILGIARKYGYTPNIMARSLVTKQTRTIGLIIPDIVNPFFPEIARGVEDKASQCGYSVIYCNTDDTQKREDEYINILTEKTVDGIIFAHSSDREGGFESLNRCGVPVVLIDRDYENMNVAGRVMVDNRAGAFQATEFLLDRGYKNIAYIAGPIDTATAMGRMEGYKQALESRGIAIREELIKVGEYRLQWGMDAVKLLLNKVSALDGIFCGNDLIAIGAIKQLGKMGISVPEGIGIVGFDDIYIASLVNPALTTIRQPNYEMGYSAAEMLIESIERFRTDEQETELRNDKVLLPTQLIIRKSTK